MLPLADKLIKDERALDFKKEIEFEGVKYGVTVFKSDEGYVYSFPDPRLAEIEERKEREEKSGWIYLGGSPSDWAAGAAEKERMRRTFGVLIVASDKEPIPSLSSRHFSFAKASASWLEPTTPRSFRTTPIST